MSYILDALKKSDQERKQGEIPTLESIHADLASFRLQRSAKRRKWFLLLGFACLTVIAVGLWQWQSPFFKSPAAEKTGPAGQVTSEKQPTPPPPPDSGAQVARQPAAPAPAPATEVAPPVREAAPPQPQQPVQVRRPQPSPPASEPVEVVQPIARIQPTTPSRVIQPAPQPPAETTGRADDSPPLLKDLPPEVRKSIPEITMAGHVYSEVPTRRMIMINNKIVREGERVGDQLKLLRITWDGVILRHVNTDFQIKL